MISQSLVLEHTLPNCLQISSNIPHRHPVFPWPLRQIERLCATQNIHHITIDPTKCSNAVSLFCAATAPIAEFADFLFHGWVSNKVCSARKLMPADAQRRCIDKRDLLQNNVCTIGHGKPENQRKPDGIYMSTEIKGQQLMASTRTCVSLVTRGLWPA